MPQNTEPMAVVLLHDTGTLENVELEIGQNFNPGVSTSTTSQGLTSRWDKWKDQSNIGNAFNNGICCGALHYDTFSDGSGSDAEFEAQASFVFTFLEMKPSNPVEKLLKSGLLQGFGGRSKYKGGCTNQGYLSGKFKPSHIELYFQMVDLGDSLGQEHHKQFEQNQHLIDKIESEWSDVAAQEKDPLGAGMYLGRLIHKHASRAKADQRRLDSLVDRFLYLKHPDIRNDLEIRRKKYM